MVQSSPRKLRHENGSRSTVAASTAFAITATAPSGETTVGLASPNAAKLLRGHGTRARAARVNARVGTMRCRAPLPGSRWGEGGGGGTPS
eukprot:5746374-Prymnesium_polylepis.2